MDQSIRKITKIARSAQQFTSKALMNSGIGLSEYEFIHEVRKYPGISQSELSKHLHVDKAAIARRCANLLKKRLIMVIEDDHDKRAKKIFLTENAVQIKDSKNEMEAYFYEWLFKELDEKERNAFLRTLDTLYVRAKTERKADFQHLMKIIGTHDD